MAAATPSTDTKRTVSRSQPMSFFEMASTVGDQEVKLRLLEFIEREQRNGMELARLANRTARVGQIFGFLSVLLVLGLAAYVAHLEQPEWATCIAAIDVVGVAGTFVTGQVTRAVRRRVSTAAARPAADQR